MLTLGLIALGIPAFQPPDEKPLSLCRSWIVPSADDLIVEVSGLPFGLFVDDSYRMYLMRFPVPERVTVLGMAGQLGVTDDRLDDYSPSYTEETRRIESTILDLLRRFDRDALTPAERFSPAFYPMDGAFPFSIPWPPNQLLTSTYPIRSRNDVLAYLDRLRRVGTQLEQLKDWLEKQADNGVFIPPSVILSEMPWMLWVPFPEERSYSPLFACLREEIKSAKAISTPDRGQYLSEAWSIMVETGCTSSPVRRLIGSGWERQRREAPITPFFSSTSPGSRSPRRRSTSSASAR